MKTSRLLSPVFEASGDASSSSQFTLLELVQNSIEARPGSLDAETETEVTSLSGGEIVEMPQFRQIESRPNEFFAAIQEWEGVVTGVYADFFTANLYDMKGPADEISELAEISYDDIDPADRHKVQEGAIFRWLIGHSRTRSDTFSRKWMIYFRRAARRPISDPVIELPPQLRHMITTQIDAE